VVLPEPLSTSELALEVQLLLTLWSQLAAVAAVLATETWSARSAQVAAEETRQGLEALQSPRRRETLAALASPHAPVAEAVPMRLELRRPLVLLETVVLDCFLLFQL
jgi:hypothetical protein